MKKKILYIDALVATVMLFCVMFLSSCVADSADIIPVGTGDRNLYISIKTESLDGTTRGVSITTNPDVAYENHLGKTLVCIFDTDGKLVQYKAIDDLHGVAQQMTQFDGKSYAANYTVAVASNLPSDIYDALVDALDDSTTENPYMLTSLQAIKFTIAEALNENVLSPESADARRIPMYGEGQLVEVVENETTNYYADIRVKHSLVKVSLNQLIVDFGESSNRHATFQPDQVFLTNVPDITNMSADIAAPTLNFETNKMYQGDAAITYVTTEPTSGQVKYDDANTKKQLTTTIEGVSNNLIGTGLLTGDDLKTLSSTNTDWLVADNSAKREFYFYTLPSAQTGADATYLVVSGTFSENGTGSDNVRVYYRVRLNANGTDGGALAANTNYKVNMIIRGKGGVDAYTDGTDPTLVESFVTTGNFEDSGQDATLGVGAGSYTSFSDGHIVMVGDILFSDGVFKSQNEAAAYYNSGSGPTPIGIVFHMFNAVENANTTEYPTYNGYRGLVMALKDANNGVKWGIKETTTAVLPVVPLALPEHTSSDEPDATAMTTLRRSAASYMKDINKYGNNGWDNWAKTAALRADTYDEGASNAFKAVAAFDADGEGSLTADVTILGSLTTSGWYLPSIGELYKMTYSLGKLQTSLLRTSGTWGNSATDGDKSWNWTPYGMYYTNGATGEGNQGVADIVRDNINAMIDACGDGTYTAFEGGIQGTKGGSSSSTVHYWSSSEWSGGYAFHFHFYSGGSLGFSRRDVKSSSHRVRPVLAF